LSFQVRSEIQKRPQCALTRLGVVGCA
jgi:hypothetical protein